MITILGRGHSGTRMLSHTLYASGVYMGLRLNPSGDKLPAQALYEACRVMGRHVRRSGEMEWDFEPLHSLPIDPRFRELVLGYLEDVLEHDAEPKGWKVPETTLIYPWIVRMFPQIHYVQIVRDPRDVILGSHFTDHMEDFGVDVPETGDPLVQRAVSWLYQVEIVRATPRPERFLTVRFEDFILRQEETLERLEDFLGLPLARIVVRPESVGRWRRRDEPLPDLSFLADAMAAAGYELE